MFKKLTIATMIALFVGSALQAKPERRGGEDEAVMAEHMITKMQKDLGLSADQVKQINAIREKYQPKRKAVNEKIAPTRKELMDLMMSDTADRAKFEAALRKLSDIRIEARLVEFDQRQETMAVLTADQKTKWKQVMQNHRNKMKENRPHQGKHEKPNKLNKQNKPNRNNPKGQGK